ncbi:voltage-gated sodium channel [Geoalkalibacter ferrihydriticus]|nr:ion transporter [Geoalkalibacter ferrihydriticus]SDL96243.1 voltage-gated sodium channel [Geoalkalibacter ferrihydriticus]
MGAVIDSGMGWRARLHAKIESRLVQRFIIVVIILNGVVLGLETEPRAVALFGGVLETLDRICLGIFVVEIGLAMVAGGLRFFRDPWRVFDFIVVGIALIPAAGAFSVLRSLRVLRVLRLVSAAPQMRSIVRALLSAIPGLSSICLLLMLVFYVAAVVATNLFATSFPEWFGTIGASMYTLFQVMTLESWSMGIVRPVLEVYPYAWLFFIPFIMTMTFTMLNLFIAVIVNAIQTQSESVQEEQIVKIEEITHQSESCLHTDIAGLRGEIRELKELLGRRDPG